MGPSTAELSPQLGSLLWTSGASIQPPHAAVIPLHLPALYWLSTLGGRLEISVNSGNPAADDCLLPAITIRHEGSKLLHISGPQRASSTVYLPLWQMAGVGVPIGVPINAVVDPCCTYQVRCAFRARLSCTTSGVISWLCRLLVKVIIMPSGAQILCWCQVLVT